jgi:hypothetical protein
MACRLPKQIGVSRADISDIFQGKSILFIGIFTRALQISAKWSGMNTVCVDGFCPFDLKKTADCCTELLDSESLSLSTLFPKQNTCDPMNLSKIKARIEEFYRESIINLLDHKYDYIYPDSYFFNSPELWSSVQNLENIVIKIDPSKIFEFQSYLSSLRPKTCKTDEYSYQISYFCALIDDTIEILMKTIEIYDSETKFPIIKSTLHISEQDYRLPQFIEIRKIAKNFSIIGIIEFTFNINETEFSKGNIIPETLSEIRPYIDANSIELFETATGISLIQFDLQLISNREFPHHIFREDFKNRIKNGLDKEYQWSIFRFFSPVRFSVFSDIGGYGFRDYPMPGTQILLGNPICSEIVQNPCEKEQESTQIHDINDLKKYYEQEKQFIHKILGLHYYLK